jgi:hypothetical protein
MGAVRLTLKRCSATLRSPLSMMYSSALCRKLDRIQAALCCARKVRNLFQGTDVSAALGVMLTGA